MKKYLRYGLVAAISLLIAGCSDPRIDASTEETMRTSSEKVRNSLPDSRRAEFDEALQVLAFNQVDINDLFSEGEISAVNIENKIRSALNGKAAEEVIAEAERLKVERHARERKQALEEIKELEYKQQASIEALEELKKFEVIRSRFTMRERDFGGKQPIIELTVKNGTNSPVSRAYFEGTIASPSRSVPWLKETFNYSISGGIEPGEEASWSLAPNMFSNWGTVDAPDDAIFTVTTQRLDGPDGEALYSVRGFGEREAQRLSELKSRYSIE